MLDFQHYPLPVNLAITAAAAGVIWFAGTRLAGYAETISDRTRAGKAFVGILLLGGIVSLPEMATSVTAAAGGHADLAVDTLLGGIAATMVVLAVVDVLVVSEPISTDVTRPVVLLQGALGVLLLIVAAAGLALGDVAFLGVGVWSTAILVLYVLFMAMVREYQGEEPWVAGEPPEGGGPPPEEIDAEASAPRGPDARGGPSLRRTLLSTAAAAGAILVAGYTLANASDALATQTGLGASFVGLVLGGIATSLPEISTVTAAARQRQYQLAFSDAFGSNLFSTMLIFFADAAYPGGPVLNEVGRFALVAVLLGAAVTTIYLAGIIERRNRVILRMGIDSLVVLVVFALGLVLLYRIR